MPFSCLAFLLMFNHPFFSSQKCISVDLVCWTLFFPSINLLMLFGKILQAILLYSTLGF